MAAIHLRQDKERPLTIEEVDSNFDSLNREIAEKLDTVAFNATNILEILDGKSGEDSGLDCDKIHGFFPSKISIPNTVAIRDDLSNIYANQFYGVHVGAVLGNVTGNLTGTVTGNASNVDGVVQVEHGGTGSVNSAGARINLGLGTISTQSANNVEITGGSISGIADLSVTDGGTGASTPSGARTNLGLVIGSDVQAYHATLTGLSVTTGNGFLVRKTDNTSVVRKFVAGNSIEITNLDGTAGDITFALTLNPSVTSITKTGVSGTGDLGSSGNRFGTLWGNYVNVTNVNASSFTKSGTNGSGDLGQNDNRFNYIYTNYVVCSNISTGSVTKTGNNGSGDLGQSDNRFGTVFAVNFNSSNTVSGVNINGTYGNFSGTSTSYITKTGGNGAGDVGQNDNRFNVLYGRSTSATYADLAEKYTTDKQYEPGTVMVVAMAGEAEATACFQTGQRVMGVISTNPAFVMNDELDGQAIGLTGRLPVKVVGPIRKGQSIISNQDGKAIVGDGPNVFGQALETNLEHGVKLVECFIK